MSHTKKVLLAFCLLATIAGHSQTLANETRSPANRWAKDVTPDKPHNEYPRPQMERSPMD